MVRQPPELFLVETLSDTHTITLGERKCKPSPNHILITSCPVVIPKNLYMISISLCVWVSWVIGFLSSFHPNPPSPSHGIPRHPLIHSHKPELRIITPSSGIFPLTRSVYGVIPREFRILKENCEQMSGTPQSFGLVDRCILFRLLLFLNLVFLGFLRNTYLNSSIIFSPKGGLLLP